VVAFDNRGHGQSAKLYTEGAYDAQHMAEDACRLLDHLHISRAHVMGYSMGARISTLLAADHPERVKSLIIGGMGINMVRGFDGRGHVADALEAPRLDDVTDPGARSFRRFAEDTGSDLRALAACMRAPGRKVTQDMLAGLRMPVLAAVGTEDEIAGSAAELAALIPGAEVLDIPRRDHMRAVGDRVYKDAVLAFLARQSV
jgi:pimeloyl-ACP methyl ester carboxylesterase